MGIKVSFLKVDNRLFCSFGITVSEGKRFDRVQGRWIEDSSKPDEVLLDKKNIISSIITHLPKWKFLEGFNTKVFRPDPHQWLAADYLATNWLQCINQNYSDFPIRTRVLIADEGGTGKTLTSVIGARWIYSHHPGTILVLCPPLLRQQWTEHFQAIFSDNPDIIHSLSSAQWFDPKLHSGQIVIVSKYSWIYHWSNETKLKNVLKNIQFSGVIIDEVHQGRTGSEAFNSGESSNVDDKEMAIEIIQSEEEFLDSQTLENQYTIYQKTCRRSKFAFGLSATPINLNPEELWGVLTAIGAESAVFSSKEELGEALVSETIKKWNSTLISLKSLCKTTSENCVGKEEIQELIHLLHNNEYPRFWGISEEQKQALIIGLKRFRNGVTPPFGLRLYRELHPLGQNMIMTLREDLSEDVASRFRQREDKKLSIPIPLDIQRLMELNSSESLLSKEKPVFNTPQTITIASKLFTSHPRSTESYPSQQWSKRFDPERNVRLEKLVSIFLKDQKDRTCLKGKCHHNKGAVLFVEYRYPIKAIQIDLDQIICDQNIVGFQVYVITGDTPQERVRIILDNCQRDAKNSSRYPILLCTSAAEVGLSMPWATYLVHWDPHTNPQRMEQRTWRLDRRLRDDDNHCREYTVLHVHYENHPVHLLMEERINERYHSFCKSLGLTDREYIPLCDSTPNKFSKGGSKYSSLILNQELQDADSYIGRKNNPEKLLSKTSKIQRLANFEKLFISSILYYSGQIFDDCIHQILREKFISLKKIRPEKSCVITSTDALISDLSITSKHLALSLAGQYRPWQNSLLQGHWANLLIQSEHSTKTLPSIRESCKKFFDASDIPVGSYEVSLNEKRNEKIDFYLLDSSSFGGDLEKWYLSQNRYQLYFQDGSEQILSPFKLIEDTFHIQEVLYEVISKLMLEDLALQELTQIENIVCKQEYDFVCQVKNEANQKMKILKGKIDFLKERLQILKEEESDEEKITNVAWMKERFETEYKELRTLVKNIEKISMENFKMKHVLRVWR